MAYDLLTVNEDAEAAQQGWGLYHVYDSATSTWAIRILPAAMLGLVVNLAKANHPLPLKALRLVAKQKAPKK